MRRLFACILALILTAGSVKISDGQDFSEKTTKKRKFILGVYENMDWNVGSTPTHDNLSFTAAFIGSGGNHNELSINKLKIRKNKFALGAGYQYKWQWLKKLPVNPYVGFYSDVDFQSENVLSEDLISDYSIRLSTGVAPGINANIGRFYIDGSLRLDMFSTSYSKQESLNLSTLTELNANIFGFKDRLKIRVGGGFKF